VRRRRFQFLRNAALLLAVLVIQVGAVADLRLWGVTGDLLLVLTIAVALLEGPDAAAGWGFAAGIGYDLLLDTPFGLSALTYAAVGYLVGLVGSSMVRATGWWPVTIAAVATIVAVVFYACVGNLVGVGNPLGAVPRIAGVEALFSALLILPVMNITRRVFGRTEPDRVAVGFRERMT
jgi:rod shape-determining protein MreD